MLTIDDMPAWVREYSRSIMVLAISVTLGFVSLILLTQMSLIERAHSSSQSSYYLSHDIAELRTQWSQAQVHDVSKQSREAEQMLLRDFDHLTRWLQGIESQASVMGLRSKYRVRPTRTPVAELNDVEVIPVDLEIFPDQPAALAGAYEQYVHFLRFLSEDQIRVDLQEVQVRGGVGATNMNVVIHVWVKATA